MARSVQRISALTIATILFAGIYGQTVKAAETASISGTVTAQATGAALSNVEVDAYDASGNSVLSTTTAADGSYTLAALAAGTYRVGFTPLSGNLLAQFYNGKNSLATADAVPLVAGASVSGIDGALPAGGQIAGTVTAAANAAPIAGVEVEAYNATGNLVTTTTTGSDGAYLLAGLATGAYDVQFTPLGGNFLGQFYAGESDLASADPVSVVAGGTVTGIDAALATGGRITGTVTDSASGAAVSGATVELYDASGNLDGSTTTTTSGLYTFAGIPTGSYVVGFSADSQNYLPIFYNGKSTLNSADVVAVTAGATTSGINAAMQTGAQISGTVTDSTSSSPIQGIEVDAYDSSGTQVATTYTANDGSYILQPLPPGSYRVEFTPGIAGGANYVTQYYNDKATLATADPIVVTAGENTTAIDAALAPGGQISGTVTDAAAASGLGNVTVAAYDSTGRVAATTVTASDGTYTLTGLASGNYAVQFAPLSGNYLTEFYNGKATLVTADPVAVAAGSTVSGIDEALPAGGQITGTVTAATGGPAAGVEVDAYDTNGNVVSSTTSAQDGTYTLAGLATGSYRLDFTPASGNALPEFYNGKATLVTADPVAVAAGSTVSGIDEALPAGGQITGTVTAATGGPAAGVEVDAYDTNGNVVSLTRTRSDGTYVLDSLNTGSYGVGFAPSSSLYTALFYNDSATLAGAIAVAAQAGQSTNGIDAVLASRAVPAPLSNPSISGTAQQGQALTEAHGNWSHSPTAYTYQWEDCDSAGANCSTIAGATSQAYTLAARDVGHTIRVRETATNASGSGTPASSAATATVQPLVTASNSAGGQATSNQVGPVAATGPTTGQVEAALIKALAVYGPAAKIAQVLTHGGLVIAFTAPSAGHLVISWFLVPKGAHLTKTKKPTLVATASVNFRQPGKAKVKITLTRKGRRLLKGAKQMKLTEKGSFTPSGGTTTSKTKTINLKR